MQNKKTTFLIVEDEVFLAEYLSDLLKSLQFEHITMAHDVSSAIDLIESFHPDIVLLDIRMEEEFSGFKLAEIINNRYHIPFIFITSHSDDAILENAMHFNPAGYLTKPFKKIDLYAAINMVLKNVIKEKEKYLILKEGHSEIRVKVSTILFAKSDGNYITINCSNKAKHLVRHSLEWLLVQLSDIRFVRCHRSYIVNVSLATKLNADSINVNGNKVPVSRSHISEIREKLKSI